MVRKLALAVSLALGTVSVPAHALGLGELSSKSSLNQNFQGDIKLLSVQPEELDGVRVKLADADAFSQAGVDRPFYLSLLKFEPTLSARGNPVIRVTSEFPIREPFMNFLIEVNWPNGRLLREYTVLLDPPTTTRRRPPAVTPVAKAAPAAPAPKPVEKKPTAPAVAAPTVSRAQAPAFDGSEYGPVKANETAWSIAKKVRPAGVSMEQMMIALLNANPQAFLDGNVNLLRRGQILRVPTQADIQELTRQRAREIYRQQQDEWLARRDQRLQQKAAESEVAKAETDTGAAEPAETGDQLRIATARPEGSGEAGAGDDDAVTPTSDDLKSRLMVARENAETTRQEAETLRTRVEDLQARLQDMQRLLTLKDEQLAQLQDRVGLEEAAAVEPLAAPEEGPVEAAGQAVEAQPDAAAEVAQEAVAEDVSIPVARVQVNSTVPEGYVITDVAPQVDPDPIVEAAATEPVTPEAGLEAEAAQQAEVGDLAATDAPVAADSGLDVVEIVEGGAETVGEQQTVEVTEAPIMEPPAVPTQIIEPVADEVGPVEPAKSDSFIPAPLAKVLEQNMLPIAGGAGAVLLGLIGWLVARRRRKPEQDEAPTGAAVQAPDAAVTAGTAAAAGAVVDTGSAEPAEAVDQPAVDDKVLADLPDSVFLDELSPADINALQDETGEVDPVSEADVYIAYGRYQQAEELLRQAMGRDPERLALRYKLLEVHYATRDADAFVAVAEEMVDAGEDSKDPAAWARAQDMGRELAPGNALFEPREEEGEAAGLAAAVAGVTAGVAAAVEVEADAKSGTETGAATVDEDTLSLEDLELSELQAAYEEEGTDSAADLEAPSEVSITLDLEDEMPEVTAATALAEPAEVEPAGAIPLEALEGIDLGLPEAEQDDRMASTDADDDLTGDTLDLEAMMAEAEAAVDQDDAATNLDSEFSAAELQAQLDDLSELSVLDTEFDEAEDAETSQMKGPLGLVTEDQGAVSEGIDDPFNLDSDFGTDEGDDEISELLAVNDAMPGNELASEDEVTTKLDLARAYVEMGDSDGARSILEEVVVEGNDSQRGDAEQLLAKLG